MGGAVAAIPSILQGGLALGSMFGGGDSGTSQSDIYNSMAPQFQAAQGLQQQNIALSQKLYSDQTQAILMDAAEQAKLVAVEGRQKVGQHSIDYMHSGVMPLLKVLQKERQMIQADVASIQRRGMAQANLLRMQGAIAANEGRAQMIGANMQFNAQRQQAAMVDSASKGNNFMSALGSLSNIFGGGGFSSLKGMFGNAGSTGTPGYAPGFPAPGIP